MNFNGPADTPSRTPLLGRAWCVRLPPRTARSAERFGRRAACPHAAMTRCIGESRTRLRTHAPLRTRYRSSRRGRCPHRPARRRVQRTLPTAPTPKSLPLVTKGRWQAVGLTEGIRGWQGPGSYNPSVSLREPAPFTQGSLPSQASGLAAFREGASAAAVRAADMYSVIT